MPSHKGAGPLACAAEAGWALLWGMTTRIYTKTGDRGETGLFGGERVAKDHVRVEAYGTLDELSASQGVARALDPPAELAPLLAELQSLLFELGAELATPPERTKRPAGIGAAARSFWSAHKRP